MAEATKPAEAVPAAPKEKSIEQLQAEYDTACAELQRADQAVKEEERKPRRSKAHDAFDAARKKKTAATAALARAHELAGK